MQPEQKARVYIDGMLEETGWRVVDRTSYAPNMTAVAIREGLMKGNRESDYLFSLNGKAVGVLEAKREEVDVISTEVQEQLVEDSHASGDNIEGYLEVEKVKLFLETFKLPLFFAWRGYRYGWHTDWCEEGDSLVPFMLFETNLIKNTQELIGILKTQSPFAQIENSSKITNSLIYVYQSLISDLENGVIKI